MNTRHVLAVLAPPVAAMLARSLGRTLRTTTVGVEALAPFWTAQRPLIYVVWHGRTLMAPWIHACLREGRGARHATVLASRSEDGAIAACYAASFGIGVVRGSSSRGGATALRTLTAALRSGSDVVIVPDGPRGPSGRVQPGVVALAALSGALIVPFAFSACPARRLRTWDAFLLPAPFARAAAVFGAPLAISREADRERAVKDVQAALDETTAVADGLVRR